MVLGKRSGVAKARSKKSLPQDPTVIVDPDETIQHLYLSSCKILVRYIDYYYYLVSVLVLSSILRMSGFLKDTEGPPLPAPTCDKPRGRPFLLLTGS